MSVIRIRDPQATKPSHVVMIVLVSLVVGGSSLLLSAPESKTLVDGAIEWHEESPLRAIVQLLCLNYDSPTLNVGDVKMLILGLGAGLAAITLAIAVAAGARQGEEESEEDATAVALDDSGRFAPSGKAHIAPLVAAQVLVGLYLLWSFASSRWSPAPSLAIGGSILLAVQFLWSFAIGHGLSPATARRASRALVVVAGVTALVAIWYYYGRNPEIRAKFPLGNPTFLAACLIPGVLLSIALIFELIGGAVRAGAMKPVLQVAGAVAVVLVSLWAFYLAGSRGPLVGLVIGALGAVFFALRRWMRVLPVFLAVVLVATGWYVAGAQGTGKTGRSATIRFREYAWSYAGRMFEEKPITGYGQGGYALRGDYFVVQDVLDDPLVFTSRISHAHNEWLEVLADLGSIGLVLIGGALLLTLRAGMLTLRANPPPGRRWALIGLMGSLIGLVVEECFGVGLRVSGVPALFYTVVGLIWALSAHDSGTAASKSWSATPPRRAVVGVLGCVIGLAALVFIQRDFSAARNTYRIERHLAQGEFDDAIGVARLGAYRLNPQRALMNLYRLGEAHMLAARELQDRALKRKAMSEAGDLADPLLARLAADDLGRSDEHCVEGSKVLSQLVQWSPGYLNHGYLEYALNRILARNRMAADQRHEIAPFLANAAAAIERELRRQPFNVAVTSEYLLTAIESLSAEELIDTLARPLRHNRLTSGLVDMLRQFCRNPEFVDHFAESVEQAGRTLSTPRQIDEGDLSRWAPEKMRLAAKRDLDRGKYAEAVEALELAAAAYDKLADEAPVGAASCYFELAVCRLYHRPEMPELAISSASRAIELAPHSQAGRRLIADVKQRMIGFHLAAGDEQAAREVLIQLAPAGTSDLLIDQELGSRYTTLCYNLLNRPAENTMRVPPDQLPSAYSRWVARAIELAPNNYLAYYVAADLAVTEGDCPATAHHMDKALQCGLPAQTAWQFLSVARSGGLICPELEEVWNRLEEARKRALDEKAVATPSPLPSPTGQSRGPAGGRTDVKPDGPGDE